MTFHFVNQYGNSKAVPLMFLDMTEAGTMFFFSCITGIGLIWVYFCLPELAGKSLESIDAIFELPWYMIGRKYKLVEGQGALSEMYDKHNEKQQVEERIEEAQDDLPAPLHVHGEQKA